MIRRFAGVLAALLLWALPVRAQEPPSCPVVAGERADTAARPPDVLLRAAVSARELRVNGVPKAQVRLLGCELADSVRVLERRNLPSPLAPGTYRDVFVAVEILGYLDAHCLLSRLGVDLSPTAVDSLARAGTRLRFCRGAAQNGENR